MRACWSILNLKSIEWQLQLKLQMVLKRSQSWSFKKHVHKFSVALKLDSVLSLIYLHFR